MFKKGVLDLGVLSESSEFDTKAKNGDPDNHVDDPNVSIPGGLKEQPTKDAIVMTTKEYDDARAKLKQSFKECGAMMDMLSTVKVVNENGEQQTGGNLTMNELYKEYLMGYAESGITEPPVTFDEFVERVSGGSEEEPEENISESAEDDVMKEAYTDYLMQFAESGIDEAPCSFAEFVEAVDSQSSITEATRLAKEIHKANVKNDESKAKIKELRKMLDEYPTGSPRYKMIMRRIDALQRNDGTIKSGKSVVNANNDTDSIRAGKIAARSKNSEDADYAKRKGRASKAFLKSDVDITPAKKKESAAEFKKRLNSIGESVSGKEFLEMYIGSITDDSEE